MILIKKVGRKPHINFEQAQEIVNNYIATHKIIKHIKYDEVHAFCKDLHSKGDLESFPEISFWRKKDRIGGKVIEETNFILMNEFNNQIEEKNRLNLLKILRDANIDDSLLKLIDQETKHNLKMIEKQEDNIYKMNNEIQTLKEKNNKLTIKNNKLQTLVIQIYNYIFENYPERSFDLINTAMQSIFTNPLSFLDNGSDIKNKSNNVISNHFLNKLKK